MSNEKHPALRNRRTRPPRAWERTTSAAPCGLPCGGCKDPCSRSKGHPGEHICNDHSPR